MSNNLYAERDIECLDEDGNFYSKHVMAMTSEGLHSKSAIAAELGYRDSKIVELQSRLDRANEERNELAATVETLKDWRRLALQFDGHRMQAMSTLKVVASGNFDIEEVRKFIAAAPVSGNEHLRDVRAEAGKQGWGACVDWIIETTSSKVFSDEEALVAYDIGVQYAESVKAGEK